MNSEPWLRYWLNCYLPLMSSFIFYLVTYLHTSRENASTSQTELSAKALYHHSEIEGDSALYSDIPQNFAPM